MAAQVICDECDAKIRLRDNLRYCPECGAALRDDAEDGPDADEAGEEDE
jgi:predicted amidophosphoribosyltransferase